MLLIDFKRVFCCDSLQVVAKDTGSSCDKSMVEKFESAFKPKEVYVLKKMTMNKAHHRFNFLSHPKEVTVLPGTTVQRLSAAEAGQYGFHPATLYELPLKSLNELPACGVVTTSGFLVEDQCSSFPHRQKRYLYTLNAHLTSFLGYKKSIKVNPRLDIICLLQNAQLLFRRSST